MSNSSFDWDLVDKAVNKKRTSYEFETSKHLFKKVAFDQFKSLNGSTQLWELRANEEDGKEYLVALYDDAEDLISVSEKKNDWEAVVDGEIKNITIAFKKTPIHKISLGSCDYTEKEANKFASFIQKKANTGNDFAEKILASMSPKRKELVSSIIYGNQPDSNKGE